VGGAPPAGGRPPRPSPAGPHAVNPILGIGVQGPRPDAEAARVAPEHDAALQLGPAAPQLAAPQFAAVRSYTVQHGDTLIGIARKCYGPEHGDQWRRILEANRAQIPSAEALRPMLRLRIPPLPGARPPLAGPPAPGAGPGPSQPAVDRPPLAVAVRTYEVQPGDTLSGIAARFLGSAEQYPKLLEWNRDVLSDPLGLRPFMKLRVEARAPPTAGAPPTPAAAAAPGAPTEATETAVILPPGADDAATAGGIDLPDFRLPPMDDFEAHMARVRRMIAITQRIRSTPNLSVAQYQDLLARGMLEVGFRDRARIDRFFRQLTAHGFPWQRQVALETARMDDARREAQKKALFEAWVSGLPASLRTDMLRQGRRFVAQNAPRVFVDGHEVTAPAAAPVAPAPRREADLHVVQIGETLSRIAAERLGSSARWEDLLRWNRDRISDENHIRPGMRLRLSPPQAPALPAAPAPPAAPPRRESPGGPPLLQALQEHFGGGDDSEPVG
jgi:nucleoid-associated protein YgaU